MGEEIIQNSELVEKKSNKAIWIIGVIVLILIILFGLYFFFQTYLSEKVSEDTGLILEESSKGCSEIYMQPIECILLTDEPFILVRGKVIQGIPFTMKGYVKDDVGNEVKGVSQMPIGKNMGFSSMPIGTLFGSDNVPTQKVTSDSEVLNLDHELKATVQAGIKYKNGTIIWCEKSNYWINCTEGTRSPN